MLLEAMGLSSDVATGGIAGAIVSTVIGVVKYMDHRKGKQRDRHQAASSQAVLQAVERLSTTTSARFDQMDVRLDTMERSVTEVRSFVVGPDGDNGLRGDVREVKSRVIALEDRERDRLERSIGIPDRRTGT